MTTPIQCPKCGCPEWRRVEHGQYTGRHWVLTDQTEPSAVHSWQMDQEELDTVEPWTCATPARHPATPEIAAQLEQM